MQVAYVASTFDLKAAWRRASMQSPVENNPKYQMPWLVFLKTKWASLRVTGEFWDSSTQQFYTIDDPELCGKTLLLSRHGWILLCSSQRKTRRLFFFNPFSRAKIDIPCLDISVELCHLTYAVSVSPTSQDCIIFAIGFVEDTVKISISWHGEEQWTTKSYPQRHSIGDTLCNVLFSGGLFYCVYRSGDIDTFNPLNYCWESLDRPECIRGRFSVIVSYIIELDGKDFLGLDGLHFHDNLVCFSRRKHIQIMLDRFVDHRLVRQVEPLDSFPISLEKAFTSLSRKAVQLDTLGSLNMWCARKEKDSQNVLSFGFHSLHGIHERCQGSMVVWIEPRGNVGC
ncbi:hypothetical protein NE237_027687 [Protea cynaroides]|uniref:KIB1-4 beta-propeller domain-containing protein n=1 Tax=Protea cynaroides TaxID=273540 RepID=A0A9Q0JUF9_9MAGN|nr:hypothetical protein NE237_027687 [Protea cynaroides]